MAAWSQTVSCTQTTVDQNGYTGLQDNCTSPGTSNSKPATSVSVSAPAYNGLSLTNTGTSNASILATGTGALGYTAPIVSLTNTGTVQPQPNDISEPPYAVLAQSIGASGDGNNYQGGNAGAVTVENGGAITTPLVQAILVPSLGGLLVPQVAGIWAQSIGGPGYADKHGPTASDHGYGGNGGAVTVTLNAGASVNFSVGAAAVYALSAGGQGPGYNDGTTHHWDSGGNAGNVTVNIAGAIGNNYVQDEPIQNLAGSEGVYALSVGGSSGAANGDAKSGGNAGTVTVNLSGSIKMLGDGSVGIVAASAGGLGWYADTNDGGVGNGHHNGNGNDVTVTLAPGATISTQGELAVGIAAFSNGGNSSTTQAPPGTLNGDANAPSNELAPPGNAGNVVVTNGGAITTTGDVAIGISADSTSGGRGFGLMQLYQTAQGNQYQIDQVGAVGPGSGNPGTVSVTNTGSIGTTGTGAIGVLALSVGGSGGVVDSKPGLLNLLGSHNAGAGVAGNTVSVSNSGSITTNGALSMGVVAESVGGGGGTATGTGGVFAVGSNGGTGGAGGTVNINPAGGSITTFGDGSFGILAHSIGGGGGNGGNATGLFVAVGGNGGASGTGGTVALQTSGNAAWQDTTSGDFAPAVGLQSIGGGGGNGGYTTAYNASVIPTTAIGGSGGSGGTGGAVNFYAWNGFTQTGVLTTNGEASAGLLAQSIGGGGGSGGAAYSYNVGVIFSAAIAVGGHGGTGGDGGTVNIASSSLIQTGGLDSAGMIAQSIGGGGGHAGAALAKSQAIPVEDPPLPEVSVSAAIGGTGGAGGAGGTVNLQNDGTIKTQGDGSFGILAQSVGGGGGDGGDASAMAHALEAQPASLKAGVTIGGDAGAGSGGGDVTVTNGGSLPNGTFGGSYNCPACSGSISTLGNNATALLAQSIGGGGGTGGTGNAGVLSHNLGGETGTAVNVTFNLGGTGGPGGAGGAVTVSNVTGSTIHTAGSGAQGVLAQSIGGGGGNGGGGAAASSGDTVNVNVTIGASGGTGGAGGAVTVANGGSINTGAIATGNASGGTAWSYTTGGDAVGMLVQSIGGGGGTGGTTDAAANLGPLFQFEDFLNPPSTSYTANVGVGGSGGAGGNGGTVLASNTGTITTLGERAYGVLAQSIGGGGGSGGAVDSTSDSVVGAIGKTYTAGVSVGGGGNAAGAGGTVMLNDSAGAVFTAGYGATALIAQSIGGGGGVAGEGTVNDSATIGIGAGWSKSGGGAGGNGGTVTVNSGALASLGDDAYGILAQSIGGGGGLASAGCSNSAAAGLGGIGASICYGNTVGATGSHNPWNDASTFTVNVGAKAGSSGNGAAVSVNESGAILTQGARAFGIVAQSIGQGGGIFTASATNITQASVQPGPDQNGGSAGTTSVSLAQGGSITTAGAGAWGILAQSIGDGGGFAGDPSLNLAVPASNTQQSTANTKLDSGQVYVTVAGNITTAGANAHGIVAQSIGGGGGIQDNSTNTALQMGNSAQFYASGGSPGQGNFINITQTAGTIQTTGLGSIGILAQSSGTPTSSNGNYTQPIDVTIGGAVIGGTNIGYSGGLGAAGIMLSGGGFYDSYNSSNPASTGNFITVNQGGSISTADGAAGTAILTNDGYTSVTNNGTITGSIDLGSTPGPIANNGVLNAGAAVTTSVLTNAGTVNVGGSGAIGTTSLNGDFVQTSAGRLVADINVLAPQQADLLNVSGNAQVGGQVVPAAMALLPGSFTVLNAHTLSTTAAAQPSLVFNWRLDQAGTALTLTPSANLRPQNIALDATQSSLAGYLTQAWNHADPALATQFGYLSQITAASQYTAALDSYSAKATQSQVTSLLQSEGTILGAAMSCPVFTDQSVLLGEDTCIWAKVSGQESNAWANGDPAGFNATSATYRLGGQGTIAPDWYMGGSFGVGQIRTAANGGSSGSGTAYDGSVAVKHTMGPWLLAASLALESGAFHSNRLIELPSAGTALGITALEQSDPSLLAVGGRLRGAYEFTFNGWYIRPYGDLDLVYAHMPGFQESGPAGYALNVSNSNKMNVVLSPMVELGGRYVAGETTVLRPFVSLGLSYWPTNARTLNASFVGASSANGTFQTFVKTPDVLGNFNAGVQLYRAGGFEVKAEYDLNIGGSFLSQGGIARLAYHF